MAEAPARAFAARKAAAVVVIAGVLGAQLVAAVRPRGARLYPFVDYSMYSRSFRPGATFRTRELRARTCDARTSTVAPEAIGFMPLRLRAQLAVIAADRPGAARARDALSRAVAAYVVPRSCALEVWERGATVTRAGVDGSLLTRPRWVQRSAWPVNDGAAVAARPAR